MKKPLLILIIILYICFQGIDLWFPALGFASSYLKFTSVLLCFCLLLVPGGPAVSRRDRFVVRLALGFTLLADVLLLFTGYYTAGMFIFCGAQLCHIARYRKTLLPKALVFYGVCLLFASVCQLLRLDLPYELMAGGCYGVLILTAFVCSFASALPAPFKRLAIAGMTLFILCDINVMLFNLLPAGGYQHTAGLLMWFFYLPSQLCIVLSSASHRKKGPR